MLEEVYQAMLDEIHQIVRNRIGDPVHVIYAANPWIGNENEAMPVNNLNDIAIEGECRVRLFASPYWGNGEDYISEVLENPTWLDLCVCANEAIVTTDDFHHTFFEGVFEVEDGSRIFELEMGS